MLKSIWNRIRKAKAAPVFPASEGIIIGTEFSMGQYKSIQVPSTDVSINIGDNVCFREFCSLLVWPQAKLNIGNNVFVNSYCSINCLASISIGSNTMFGEGVKMYDHNHKYTYQDKLIVDGAAFKTGAIKIGNNCWIGANVTILMGVTIGDNVIVGANNLVYKSIPPNCIVKAKTDMLVEHFGLGNS
jgi:acetyltransferase-like isoleucine patch superfamily enzyme